MLRRILQFKLKLLASIILKRYKPIVIGITGSVGKTSTKEAVYTVLRNHFIVRLSPKNYNNELGLPLTIIGADSAGRSLGPWVKVIMGAIKLILIRDKKYPQVLILEMGADRRGDIAYLTSIAPPMIGIVTDISRAHLEYFSSLANIQKEKQVLIENINSSNHRSLAVLNYDNQLTRNIASKVKVLTYGLQDGADLQAQDLVFNFSKGDYELLGLNFKLNFQGSVIPVFMSKVMTESAVYAALAAIAVGIHFNFNLVEIAKSLSNFSMPPGRMNIIPGIHQTFLIDDTYNSSPVSTLSALDILGRIKIDEEANKYAILGDMLEIGNYTETGHRLVGTKVVSAGIEHLIVIGEKSQHIISGAKEAGLADDYIFHFNKAEEVAPFLHNKLKAGDVLLIKGSQKMRMEKIVKALMVEPDRAKELLTRQGKEWLNN